MERRMTFEIHLLSFSTDQHHPLAQKPIIFVTTKSLIGHCNVLIEIVGDFLALLITFPWARNENEDMFFLVRWKKGETHCVSVPRTQRIPSHTVYPASVFRMGSVCIFQFPLARHSRDPEPHSKLHRSGQDRH